ncbi:MerR family transcriptional regulator [Kribbella sp. NPDC051770]|uniref:MerR family transcriptional regulator n=1 Tax=Kribbella sp. NPDC051770 TaxID=3155413 RepID=UPI003417DD94
MTYSIGELSRRTGLSVKTIRFYSDRGVVPTTRSTAGYRQYDAEALSRLELIRALRDLGVPLARIEQLLAGAVALEQLIRLEEEALEAQQQTLRLRQAVLRAARRPSPAARGGGEESVGAGRLGSLQQLGALSSAGRAAVVDDFLASVFTAAEPVLAAARQSMMPELPDDASVEQIEAWVRLAELAQDVSFRELMRELIDGYTGESLRPDEVVRVCRAVRPAIGLDPRSAEAAQYVEAVGVVDVDRLALAADVRRETYFELLAVVNGWAAPDDTAATLRWYLEAVTSRP